MKLLVQKATTSKLARVFIQNSSVTTGAGLTGLVYNSAGLTAYYIKEGEASATQITLATMTVGTWASGGFKEIDATNMPGFYEIGIPNACLTTNNSVAIMLKGGANMAPVTIEIQLVSFNPNDSVRMGMTALPNAAAQASGGLYTRGTGAGQINQSANGQIDVNIQRLNNVAQSLLDLVDFADAGYDPSTNKVEGVKTVDTTTTNTDMRGTDGANTTTPDAAGTAATLIAALNNISAADVNAEVLDVLNSDTFSIPGQGLPSQTPTLVYALTLLYKALINKTDQSNTGFKIYANDGTTVDQKSTDSDDGTTRTSGKLITGP